MRPASHTETKPWWYVSALEGVRKQTDENSEALQRMNGTIHGLQKKLKEAVKNMSDRCISLESSCGELSAKLDTCMTMRGELKATFGQLHRVKEARDSESNVMDGRMAALEWSYQQDKANTDDFRTRLSYDVAQEVGELREALQLESATVSASMRNLILDVEFAAQKVTELRQEAGAETPRRCLKTSAPDSKHEVAGVITDEPHLQPKAHPQVVAVQKELAQALESHLRCLHGVIARSSTATEKAPANLADELSARVARILEAQTNQTEERILAKLGIHSVAADWTKLASGDSKDKQATIAPSRRQQQARGQPSADGCPVATASGLVTSATTEEFRKVLQRNSPAAAAAATASPQRRRSTSKRVSVSRGDNRMIPLLLAPAEAASARGLSQPIQAARRTGPQRLLLRSTRSSSVTPTSSSIATLATPLSSSISVPVGTHIL